MYDEEILSEMLNEMDDAFLVRAISYSIGVIRGVVNDLTCEKDYPSDLGCLCYVRALLQEKVKREREFEQSPSSDIVEIQTEAISSASDVALTEAIAAGVRGLTEATQFLECKREYGKSLVRLTNAIVLLQEMVNRETASGVVRVKPKFIEVGTYDFPGGTIVFGRKELSNGG